MASFFAPPSMTEQKNPERAQRKSFIGLVTSDKMAKTVVVRLERLVKDPRFGKYVRRFTKCYTHDEKGEAKAGDKVEIMETRPLSRLKRWRLVRVIQKAGEAPAAAEKA